MITMGPADLCHSSRSSKTACGTPIRIPTHPFAPGCVSLAVSSPTTPWGRNWKGFSTCSWYAIHKQQLRSPRFYPIRGCHWVSLRVHMHEAPMSLVIHRPSLWVVDLKLRVKHLAARLALRPRSTTTTSRTLGKVYRLSQKARRDLHRQMLPCPKPRQLSKSWQTKQQLKSKG